jgi:hypothetical protein
MLRVNFEVVLERSFLVLEPAFRKLEGEWTEFLAEGPKVLDRMWL